MVMETTYIVRSGTLVFVPDNHLVRYKAWFNNGSIRKLEIETEYRGDGLKADVKLVCSRLTTHIIEKITVDSDIYSNYYVEHYLSSRITPEKLYSIITRHTLERTN